MKLSDSQITYEYVPENWSQEAFLSVGGFVCVFLNYNKLDSIERSVKSALDQDFSPLEFFFMDDCSSDGSEAVMEKLVRTYKGPNKVTVVRNSKNQYITGQWNIVTRLATGNWFGMFCGDDVSHQNRVSIAESIIKRFPTIKGMCTSTNLIDFRTNESWGVMFANQPLLVSKGTDTIEELARNFKSIGASSFWHRSLFEIPLPKVPLDDDYLHWRCLIDGSGSPDALWVYNGEDIAVDYSIGTGVTSNAYDLIDAKTPVQKWIACKESERHFASQQFKTLCSVCEYASGKKAAGGLLSLIRLLKIKASWYMSGTVERSLNLHKLLGCLFYPELSFRFKSRVVNRCLVDYCKDFFGLQVAARLSCLVHRKRI